MTIVFGVLMALFVYALAGMRVFFTFCPGGEIVSIVKGKEPKRFIMSHKGFHLNDPEDRNNFDDKYDRWDVIKNDWRKLPAGATLNGYDEGWKDNRNWLEKKFGIYWVGIFPLIQVYRYFFQWAEVQQKETPPGQEGKPGLTVKVRGENVYSIFAKVFPYLMELEEAPTSGGLPVKMRYVLNIRCINPLKALFWVDNWLAKTQTAANENARNYVGGSTYKHLLSEIEGKVAADPKDDFLKDADGNPLFFETIMLWLNDKMGNRTVGLKQLYGVEIVTVEIQSVNLTSDLGKRASEATMALYVAEQEAKAAKARADGLAAALKAEAEVMATNNYAPRLRELQALEKAGANVTIVSPGIGVTPMLPISTSTPPLPKP
ncbi:MAG TPA: SPFH domain-containing protein [Candidatus Paceibacterota bacterium]